MRLLPLLFLGGGLLALAGCSESPTTAPVAASATEQDQPDFPGDALRWQQARWQDENGLVPTGAWHRALQQRRAVEAATALRESTAGVAPSGWVSRGPTNVAGRSRTLAIDPRDTDRLWSGGVGGGLWRSENRGQSWQLVDDWWANLAVASLTLDPSNPDVMYVGTGEGFLNVNVQRGVNSSAVRGAGVFRSADGGATWVQLPGTESWANVARVAVSPADPDVVLAALRPGGIWRSTDGGTTWAQVDASFASYQVVFDPNDGSRAVAHVMDAGLASHGVVRSVDGGATWQPASSGLTAVGGYDARIEMCYAASSPNVVYASVGENGGSIWRSADGGASWVRRTTSGTTDCNWYYNGFWVDPTNENVMVVGAFHVWRSVDGGRSVQQITDGYIMTTDPHLDVHNVVADPGYNGVGNRRVYVTTDGGLHVAADIRSAGRNTGWQDLDNGQVTTQFYGVDAHAGAGLIVGGTQDNGTQRLLGSSPTSNMTFGGDGGQVAIDPSNSSYVYGEYVWLRVFRSTNGGGSARFQYSGLSDAENQQANFVAPLVLDPNQPLRLYGGGASLWRTDDARASRISWRAVKPSVGSFISAVAVTPGDANRVWVAHNDGRLYRSTNATAVSPAWTAFDDNAARDPLPDRYVTRLVVDPADPNVVWVTLGGFTTGNVWVTRDGGASWNDTSGSGATALPAAPVYGLARHPDDAEALYVATEVGVFASDDGGVSWSANNEGPANVSCEEIKFIAGTRSLVLATMGRGLWTCEVRRPAVADYGVACSGDAAPPTLDTAVGQAPRLGRVVELVGAGLTPATNAWLLLGSSDAAWAGGALPQSLDGIRMTGCQLFNSAEVAVAGAVGSNGELRLPLALPDRAELLGSALFAQLIGAGAGVTPLGLRTSAGLRLTIGR